MPFMTTELKSICSSAAVKGSKMCCAGNARSNPTDSTDVTTLMTSSPIVCGNGMNL
jgi:hypothetical protein